MIKNVVFDIGKVLIGFDWDRYIAGLFDEETASHVTAAMFGGSDWKELDRAVLSVDEIVERFHAAGRGYEEAIDEAFARVGECVARRDWVIPLVDSLRERGYRVYFLSNMSEHVMGSNPEAYDFVDHMDGGVFSCHVRLIKPDPAIFHALFDKYGLTPEECLFVDDQPDNIWASKKLGMKAIRYRDPEQLAADLGQALAKDAGKDRISVVCYGDSNTYGFDPETSGRYPPEKRWTTLLGEMLGGRYEVSAEGLNGRTTAYDRPGAEWKNGLKGFIATLGTHKPVDVLIIMLGTNDCNKELGLSAEDIASGMEKLVETAEDISPELQGYVPEIVVVSPAAIGEDYADSPFADELDPESVRKSRDIGPLYEEIARRHDCLSVTAGDRVEVSPRDCEHLSPKGHEQLADLIYKAITEDSMQKPALTGNKTCNVIK
jgi:putative hydrolase of the HAD superfamily